MKLLITGGAGFIGSNFILDRIEKGDKVLNLDKLTYSGNLDNLISVQDNENYSFIQGDIGDKILTQKILSEFRPDAVVNFAAETHVDRSVVDPESFVKTNVLGTSNLLLETLEYWKSLSKEQDSGFITSQLTKFMDLWALKIRPLEKTHHTPLIVHIQPQKHLVTTLSGLFMKPMDCRP